VRLQLHALAYNLANFLRTLATPEPMSDWSLTTLKEKLIKIGAKARPLHHVPDGRGRNPTADVPGDFATYRGTAAAAAVGTGMRRPIFSDLHASAATNGRSACECHAK
jgi:Transposase DDE domain group 1